MSQAHTSRHVRKLALALVAALGCSLLTGAPARAQTVVASVNDDPVTNIDIEQHMKILRVLHKNPTREAALEDIYETRLKLMEISKYKVNIGDPEIGWALGITARSLNTSPQQLLSAMQAAGVTEDQWKQKWKAEAGWMQFIRALNRTLEVSESEVRAELAKQGKTNTTEFTLRQIILVMPGDASGAVMQSRASEANQLRARFTDCASGIQLARGMRDTAVKEPIIRSASSLGDQLNKILDSTPVGHLTPVSRGPQGLEMIAVCAKSNQSDTGSAESLRNELVFKKLEGESTRRYREIRAKAIIVNH
jgi:peptidyl-prolyl cis-trans isomerase SurA